MARKRPHEEHENHERWLVSYADFITLLFAFFVVMYAISSVNEGKYRVLSEALVAAFRAPTKSLDPIQFGSMVRSPYTPEPAIVKAPKTVIPAPIRIPKPPFEILMNGDRPKRRIPVPTGGMKGVPPEMQDMARDIEQALAYLIEQDLVAVRKTALWIEVEIKNSILFSSGSTLLESSALPVLENIAGILRRFPNFIQVEGFTDNVPINTVAYPSNWELSAARAASVVHLFTELGIAPQRMAAVGYGEYRPSAGNDTAEGRQKNRRVVLVILANPEMEHMLALRQAIFMDAELRESRAEDPAKAEHQVSAHDEPRKPSARDQRRQ